VSLNKATVSISPEECFHMANMDDAIRQAVASADEQERETK
jgi:hypothetical protein